MKQVWHAIVLCLGLLLWSVVTTAAQQGAGPGLAAPKAYYQLRVDGLACPFCAYGIEKQLHAIKGVEDVVTDIKTGHVFVATAIGATFDQATAKKAVEDAGFRLKAFQAVERIPPNIEN